MPIVSFKMEIDLWMRVKLEEFCPSTLANRSSTNHIENGTIPGGFVQLLSDAF